MNWEIKRTDKFSAQLQDFLPNVARAEQFMSGVRWALERNPSSGAKLNSTVWFISSSSNVVDVGNLSVYYTFDETKVYLLAIRQTTENDV